MNESVYCVIKPGFLRLAGEITKRCERDLQCVVSMGKRVESFSVWNQLYAEHRQKDFYWPLVAYMSSGPVRVLRLTPLALSKDPPDMEEFIRKVRALVVDIRIEHANPLVKRENVLHAPDSYDAAQREQSILADLFNAE